MLIGFGSGTEVSVVPGGTNLLPSGKGISDSSLAKFLSDSSNIPFKTSGLRLVSGGGTDFDFPDPPIIDNNGGVLGLPAVGELAEGGSGVFDLVWSGGSIPNGVLGEAGRGLKTGSGSFEVGKTGALARGELRIGRVLGGLL